MSEENINRQAVDGYIQRWAAATQEQEEEASRLPLKVLLGEAVDLAELVEQNFATRSVHGKTRLGLDSVASPSGITADTPTEMRELQLAAGAVHARYIVLAEQEAGMSVAEAEDILSELRAALSFVLEDGHHAQGAAQLEHLRSEFSKVGSHDGVALALEGHAELASQHKEDLTALGGFDVSLMDRALQGAQALRQRSAQRLTGQTAQEQRELKALRNRLLGALSDRMRAARRAIRYVFRDEPHILRRAASDYWRSTKRKSRDRGADTSADVGTDDTLESAAAGAE